MTTKTRNIVIIIALLLVTIFFILSATTLYSEPNEGGGASLSGSLSVSMAYWGAAGGWKPSGKSPDLFRRTKRHKSEGQGAFHCASMRQRGAVTVPEIAVLTSATETE